jgi:hypothetical protein
MGSTNVLFVVPQNVDLRRGQIGDFATAETIQDFLRETFWQGRRGTGQAAIQNLGCGAITSDYLERQVDKDNTCIVPARAAATQARGCRLIRKSIGRLHGMESSRSPYGT